MGQRTDTKCKALRKTIGWKGCCPGLDRGLTLTAATFFILLSASSGCCIDCAAPSAADMEGNDEGSQEELNEHRGNGNTCFTAACNATATMILSNMDRSVEPCDNFYRYACGGYFNATKIPNDKNYMNAYTISQDKLYEQLVAILEADIEPDEPRAHRLLKKYYRSCMNEAAIEARGLQPLVASLRKIGGWPMVDGAASWNESNFDWTKAIYELRKAGHLFQDIIEFDVTTSLENSTERAIYIKPPSSSTFDHYRSKLSVRKTWVAYFDHILDVAKSVGARDNRNTSIQLREALRFELNLRRIRRLNSGSTEYDISTLAELKSNNSSIRWQEYVSGMLPSTVHIDENQVVTVKTPSYFTQLKQLMSKTPKIVQANYIAQSIALHSIDYLGKAILEKKQRFVATLAGVTDTSPRSTVCVKSASAMSFAIESAYAKKHLSADTKRNVASMVDGTKKAVGRLLETASWMDRITKSRALQKLDAMSSFIAYPDQHSDKLDKIYENLDVDEDYYYENVHKLSLWNTEYKFGQLRAPIDRGDMFGEMPATVAAMYSSRKNNFALTAGILQGAFFDKDRPWYINYGALGTVIGHEMIHAFDGDRRRIDWKGDYANWFEPISEKEYLEREQCIVDRYNNYTVQEVGLNVNGALTKNENIADNGGRKAAYLAYNNWVAKNGVEGKLPGIDMTPNQLFWMSTANLKCSKYTTDYLIDRVNTNVHAPDEFRIIGAMSNFPEFAEDFACPPGSNMNPTQKCSIW